MRGVFGKKIGMTQVFDPNGNLVPVTVIEVTANHVVQVKTASGKDGYNAVKLATISSTGKNLSKPERGVFEHANLAPFKKLGEFRLTDAEVAAVKAGDSFDGSLFVEGALVNVQATSQGKGYAGVMKRHGFKGAKESTHGTHEFRRHGGSIGAATYPGRVMRNTRMSGQMGNETVTIRNLKVVAVYADQNLILLKGAVPGARGGIVRIIEMKPKAPRKTVAPLANKKK